MSKAQHQGVKRHARLGLMVVAIILLVILMFRAYHAFWSHRHARPLASVVTAVVAQQDVPVYLNALGSVTPTNTVTVKTQISGYLVRVLFEEGKNVKKGELLAEIDPRLYEAQLVQYQGQIARDRALLKNAELDLQRYQKLWKEDSISKQALDTQAALVKQYEGTVKLDSGLLLNTEVNLQFTHITAPIDGRIGLSLVDPGNYVQASDTTGLAVINTVDPISVLFSLPEDDVPEVMEQMQKATSLKVSAYDRQQTVLLSEGTLVAMDNQVDPTTGTLKLRADFPNPHDKLFPNQFVNIRLQLKTLMGATVVPTAAIQYRTEGSFVYVVLPDSTVKMTMIKASVTTGEDTVITAGLTAGQVIVVAGADKLSDGEKVRGQVMAFKNSSTAYKHKNITQSRMGSSLRGNEKVEARVFQKGDVTHSSRKFVRYKICRVPAAFNFYSKRFTGLHAT